MRLIILFFFCLHGLAQENKPPLTRLRKLYEQAANSQDSLRSLENLLIGVKPGESPVFFCYKGVSSMLEAKYAFNPFTKFKKFYAGKALMESAIQKDYANVEMRLLRYVVQYNSPAFLGYHENLEADRAFLHDAVASLKDIELRTMVDRTLAILRKE